TLILTNANTYSGSTLISAGTLQVGNGGASGTLGTGDVTNNAALVFNRSDTVTLANPISGTGSLMQNGSGTLILTHANTSAGSTVVSNGAVLDLNGQAVAAEPVTLNGTGISSAGALINNSGSAASLSGPVTLGSASSVGGSGNITLSGVISGSTIALTKVGT